MNYNGSGNAHEHDVAGTEPKTPKLPDDNLDLAAQVIAATGKGANSRLADIMPSLVRHLHAFAKEVSLTAEEWMASVQFLNEAGQMSHESRNEMQLVCDILGLESLVDEITSGKRLQNNHHSPSCPFSATEGASLQPVTPSCILGPFYRPESPLLPFGSSIVCDSLLASSPAYSSALTHLTGRVLSSEGYPLPSCLLEIWHAGPNGLYEQQDPSQPDMHLRGRFETDEYGRFALYCLRPPPYPIPDDGPAGKLLQLLDRNPYRPAHIHFVVSKEGYASLTTQLFDNGDGRLGKDAVFAVKKDLIAEFKPSTERKGAKWEVQFDFVLSEA